MNVLLVLGRGVEGCGVTRFTIELYNYLKTNNDVDILASIDKKWGRDKAQEIIYIPHKFINSVWTSEKKYDVCIITSVPAKDKNDEAFTKVSTNFIETLKSLNCRLVYTQCDNKISSINRNFYHDQRYMNEFFSIIDRIMVHNLNADFVKKFIDKHSLRGHKFTVGQQVLISTDFDELNSEITKSDKLDKTCWFVGRSAQWKGWREFRDFHTNYLKDDGYVSVIEGIELSINAKQDLSDPDILKNENRYVWRTDGLYETGQIGYDVNYVSNNIDEFRNKPILIYGPYNRIEALNRVNKAKFGMFFTFTGPEFGGQIEITFLEIVGAGTVPVIRKELWDHAFFNDTWLKDLGTSEDLGIVVYDSEHPSQCLELMDKLNSDDVLYNEYLNKCLAFCKSQFDRTYIIKRLFDKCMSDEEDITVGESGLLVQESLW